MQKFLHFQIIFLLINFATYAQSNLYLPPALEGEIPWVFEEIAKAPPFYWTDQNDSVWSLMYEGEEYGGKVTEVFAYYASPNTLTGSTKGEEKFPAVVLVHGGGGTAFRVWAMEWAKKGYAAIAMDLSGNRPLTFEEQQSPWGQETSKLSLGGPNQDDVHKFFRLDEGFEEQWQFHSVSNIIRAHSLIRSLEEVDAGKTAITGISWGGYLTSIVAGIDHRFKAAVPVYGSGFLQKGSAWDQQFDSLGKEKTEKWVKLWDPSRYVGNSTMPMLFINGTNDFAYFVENWNKTARLAKDHQLSLIPEMKHSHPHGAEPQEIFNFIHRYLGAGNPLPSLNATEKVGDKIKSILDSDHNAIQTIYLVFTKDQKRSPERKWEMIELELEGNNIEAPIPEGVQVCYIYLKDKLGNRISSEVVEVPSTRF